MEKMYLGCPLAAESEEKYKKTEKHEFCPFCYEPMLISPKLLSKRHEKGIPAVCLKCLVKIAAVTGENFETINISKGEN